MSPTWETTSDWDSPQSETGCHHEQPASTDWAASGKVEKGYPSTDSGGSALDIYWPLDEDSAVDATDVAGSNTGSATGTTVVNGFLGTDARDGDGSDDIIQNTTPPTDGASACSILLWIKSASTGNNEGFVGENTSLDSGTGARYDADGFSGGGNNVIKFGINNQSGSAARGESASNVHTTDWQHIGITWASGEAPSLYIDGSETSYTSSPGTLSGSVRFDEFAVLNGPADGAWTGRVDEVRLFSRKLSATQVEDAYNAAL